MSSKSSFAFLSALSDFFEALKNGGDAPKNDAPKNGGEEPQNATQNGEPKNDSADTKIADDHEAEEIATEKTDDGLIKVYDTRNRIKRSISQEQIDLYPGRYKII